VPKSDDGTVDGSIFERFGKVSLETGDKFGKSLRTVDESAEYMRKAGFEDVVEKRFKVPIGPWAKDKAQKELGLYNRLQWEEGLEGWTMYLLTTVMGVSLSMCGCVCGKAVLTGTVVEARGGGVPPGGEEGIG
jgi:hypothetical protein